MSTITTMNEMINLLHEDLKIILKQQKDIENKISRRASRTEVDYLAAKVIKEVKEEIHKVSYTEIPISISAFPEDGKYSYPNHNAGNKELGSSTDPNALKWPFQ